MIDIIETTEMKITEITMKDLGTGKETDIVMVIGKKRQRDYEENGTCKKRYQSPCRHYPRKSEKDPRSCHDYTASDYENLKADNKRLQNCADNALALVDVTTKALK